MNVLAEFLKVQFSFKQIRYLLARDFLKFHMLMQE